MSSLILVVLFGFLAQAPADMERIPEGEFWMERVHFFIVERDRMV